MLDRATEEREGTRDKRRTLRRTSRSGDSCLDDRSTFEGVTMSTFAVAMLRVLLTAAVIVGTLSTGLRLANGQTLGYSYLSGGTSTNSPIALNGLDATKAYGAKGDGTFDNRAALTNIFATADGSVIYFPPGVFLISCGATFSAASGINIVGAGKAKTVLKFQSNCSLPPQDVFLWDGKTGGGMQHLTIDLNSPAGRTIPVSVVSGRAYNGDSIGWTVDDIEVIGGSSPLVLVSAAAVAGHTMSDARIRNNRLILSAADTSLNYCIDLATNFSSEYGRGYLLRSQVDFNICINSAIQIDGDYTQVIGNDVSGWRFGAGIFAAYGSATQASSRYCLISNNVLHDAGTGLDVNSTPTRGIENNCVNALLQGNYAFNLGGAGFFNFASDVTYVGNEAFGTGKNRIGSGAGGILDRAGFAIQNNGANSPAFSSLNVNFLGNAARDDGSNLQEYGFIEDPNHTFSTVLRGNRFSGIVKNEQLQAGGTSNSDTRWILTQSSVSTALSAFSFNLDTTNFRKWVLTCVGIVPTIVSKVGIQVGLGSPASWQTASSYFINEIDTSGGTSSPIAGVGYPAILIGTNNYDALGQYPGTFTATLGDTSQTLTYKSVTFGGTYYKSGSGIGHVTGSGLWPVNTNAITAVRVIAPGTTIRGSCTMTGSW